MSVTGAACRRDWVPATAARILAGGLTLEDLPSSGRLTGAKGARIRDAYDRVLARRALIRTRTDLVVPYQPKGTPSSPLPKPAEIVERLGLW